MLGLLIPLSKIIGVNYRDHQAIAFLSVTKNQSVAAAIAVMALSPEASIVPALIPMVQP
ncbi:MAG: hypothetical protein ACPLRJ_02805 [Infirmifilum uzonense]|uniref:hypothetical protein n=1 Tax=Infirmifilum uzonense TaxID=1550241 RepID=UPI003C765911